ncbi:MAG: hypothetical protein EB084_02310 [Proteobacteria bacterium]|nr:hypothetical protein [Pseudomonadota bacterium]
MALEDRVGLGDVEVMIPDPFGVHHHERTVAALVEAAALVDANPPLQRRGLGHTSLQRLVHALCVAIEGTRRSAGTYEDMLLIDLQGLDLHGV